MGDKVYYSPADNEAVNKIVRMTEYLQGTNGQFIGVNNISTVIFYSNYMLI